VNHLREEHVEKAYDLMRVNSDSVSNEIDESELRLQTHDEQKFEHDEEL
jgi:hypothetical protein